VGLRKPCINTNFEQIGKANFKCRLWNFIPRAVSLQSFCRSWKVDSCLPRHLLIFTCNIITIGGQDNSVCEVTSYGLDGPGIETELGARFFVSIQTRPETHPTFRTSRDGSFPGWGWRGKAANV